ncbi:MAG: hypothetical protein FWC36_07800 [Spirochaetes bacterium]|nr:hypothetical protein [Spirochaetota bacterium]
MSLDEYTVKMEECLKKQIEAFKKFHASEEKIKQQIVSKNWEELDSEISYLQKQAGEIEKMELERGDIYDAMKRCCNDDSSDSFYTFVSEHCPEKSVYLNSLYRDLKVSVVKVKALTIRIDSYLSTITATVTKILEEAFPMRKGTIYDDKGANKAAAAPPLLLDRQL